MKKVLKSKGKNIHKFQFLQTSLVNLIRDARLPLTFEPKGMETEFLQEFSSTLLSMQFQFSL